MNVLEEALDVIKDRGDSYGDAGQLYGLQSALWSAWLRHKENPASLSPTDVVVMMILMKLARLHQDGTHRDSIIDVAGYAAVLEMLDK